jgi:hypothetical protein
MKEEEAFNSWREHHFAHRGIGLAVQKAAWDDLVRMIRWGRIEFKEEKNFLTHDEIEDLDY